MIDRGDILTYLRQNKAELLAQFHLSKIGLFGSFARNEQNQDSDIDLLVEFEPDTENLYQLKQALRKVFERQFNLKVDICREKYIKPYYKKRILQDAIFV